MSATTPTPIGTELVARPRYEGSNIRTWIGFKHFMYLVEEAVLEWFRDQGLGPGALYHEHGLELEVLDSSVQLPALMEIDDAVIVHVRSAGDVANAGAGDGGGRFDVRIGIDRDGRRVLALRGKVEVGLIPAADPPALPDERRATPPLPEALLAFVREEVQAADLRTDDRGLEGSPAERVLAGTAAGTFYWSWVARYFHCHYSDRVQHSAFVRALEEVVDRFLASRGMSIRTMLESRGWIPVVSRARVQLAAGAHMEETIHTTFTVTDILKERAFEARMNCYVERAGRLVHVAAAEILHGYAMSRGPHAGSLVVLDRDTQQALLNGRTP